MTARLRKKIGFTAATGMMTFLFSACASTPDTAEKNLDVEMTPAEDKGNDTAVSYSNVAKPPATPDAGVSDTAVFDWRKFFRPKPDPKEREILETRLEQWRDTEEPLKVLAKGRAQAAVGRVKAAEINFRRAIRLNGDLREARLALASLYLRLGRTQRCFEVLKELKDRMNTQKPASREFLFRYRYVLAKAHLGAGDREEGHRILSDLIGLDREFAPAYMTLATSYLERGNGTVASFIVRRGLDRAGRTAGLLNLRGVLAAKDHERKAARSWFDAALEKNEHYAPALVNRATLSLQATEYSAAAADLKAAVKVDPSSADGYAMLGTVHMRQGRYSDAENSFRRALELQPDHASARFSMGVLYAEHLGRPHEAVRFFHEVLQTEPPGKRLRELARTYIRDLESGASSY